MEALDFSRNPNRKRIAAAYRTKAKEIAFPRGEIRAGKTAKIAFVRILLLPPFIVDAIQVDDFGFQAPGFQHGGQAEDADGGKLPHDASRIRLAHRLVAQLVGRGCTNEADSHRSHFLGPVPSGFDVYYREETPPGSGVFRSDVYCREETPPGSGRISPEELRSPYW